MASALFNESRVILQSLECCKKIVSCLDGNSVTLERLLEGFEPNDFFTRPKKVLDRLIQYLFLVHKLDFYGDWEQESSLTLRLDSEIKVFGDQKEEENELIMNLLAKTNNFVEKKEQVKYLFCICLFLNIILGPGNFKKATCHTPGS